MRPSLHLFPVILLLLALVAQAALAQEVSKLDARARIALSQLVPGANLTQLRENGLAVTTDGELDAFISGDVARADLEALGVTIRTQLPGLYTAYIPASVVDQVAALPGVRGIRGATMVLPTLNASVPTTGASALRGVGPAFAGLNGAGVLVGDVDSGIDVKHQDFKDPAGLTRIVNVWDQTVTGTPPSPYTYGTEWTKAQIDGGTCTETDGGGAATSGYGHGTHVMGIAAGDGSQTGGTYGVPAYTYAGMAPKADIVMVKTTYSDANILDGVAYVFARATARGQNAVCNLSLGGNYGPHDGTSDFEAGLTALVGPGRVICVSAGNDRGTGATGYPYIHARTFAPLAGDSIKLTVVGASTNPPAGSAASVAVDGYYGALDNMAVTLRAPNGTLIGPVAMGAANGTYPGVVYTGAGRVYIENGLYATSTGKKEVYFEISRTSATNTPNGTWTILLSPVSVAGGGRIDLWRFYTYTTTIGNSTQFSLRQTNENTISEPGNALGVITVAGWETKNSWVDCGGRSVSYTGAPAVGAICSFSAQGPSAGGALKPDIAAPGMGIGSTRSADATGTCPSTATSLLNDGAYHIINQGTSMASPHVAGAVALLMQRFGALSPDDVRTYLTANATLDANTGAVWNQDFGYGKLHLGDLVNPTVAVSFPNGGELQPIGTGTILSWTASDNVAVTNVDLYLSRAGAAGPWETIALGVANTGSYGWNATGPATTHALLKVVAHDAAGNAGEDVSDAEWTLFDAVTGTLMSMFEVGLHDRSLEVRWQFGDPGAWTDVHLERAGAASGPWQAVATTPKAQGAFMVAVDSDVQAGETYWYRLTAKDLAGRAATFGPISATAGEAITSFALSRIAPNPTSGVARIEYAVPRAANVRVSVHDLQGREVAVLRSGLHQPGRFQAVWSGEVSGHRAPAGVYFVHLKSAESDLTRRVIVQP